MDGMIKAICKEAELRQYYINENIATIYFGGGTPSLSAITDLLLMINTLKKNFLVEEDAEVTVEANPDDINIEKIDGWKAAGINRLSIGVQSFFDEDLQWMNRAHNAQQALQSIQLARQSGFQNITIDLIYGTPTLTDKHWQQNVERAISLDIPHLSCYALTVEPKTALEKMIMEQKKENVDIEKQSRQFEMLMQWMHNAGYEHYEISNFAKHGHRSRHNSSYWLGKNYIGLGPSAHSFNGCSRQWNISNNALYINNIEENIVPCETEYLTTAQRLNEYIMTSLRTAEGLSLQYVAENWGEISGEEILGDATFFLGNGLMMLTSSHLVLTDKGKLLADGITAKLFRE